MRKVEFGSPAWMELVADLFRQAAVASPLPLPDLTLCEMYRNAPRHLTLEGSRDIAWTLRIRAGAVTMAPESCDDAEADRKSESEYGEAIELARFVITAENAACYIERLADLERRGKYRKVRDVLPNSGELAAFAAVHNVIAQATK